MRGAEKGIRTGQRSVRAAVEDRLPATQEDIRLLTAELREISRRLDVIETRLAASGSGCAALAAGRRRPGRRLTCPDAASSSPAWAARSGPPWPAGWSATPTASTWWASTPGAASARLVETDFIEADIRDPVIATPYPSS